LATITKARGFIEHFSWGETKAELESTGRVRDICVGDEIADTLTTGEEVTFVVAGVDVYQEGQIIFTLKDCLKSRHRMNPEATNDGGWVGCEMRKYLNNTVYETLPAELRKVITSRQILTDYGATLDDLWLFSEREVFGDGHNGDRGDKHIPYYQDPANRRKKLGKEGSAADWWGRSPYSGNAASFCGVSSGGSAGSSSATGSYGVCFGFSI
jgi:hypothetical protein